MDRLDYEEDAIDAESGAERGERPQVRQFVGSLVIALATAQALGITLRTPTFLGANDISRWCTVWSLLERGTYSIDECPWQYRTQDKVKRPDKLAEPTAETSMRKRLEYRLAPRWWKTGPVTERFYSSKPPLLPTLIAGVLYPIRAATGVELDFNAEEPRNPRYVQKPVEGQPGKVEFVLETPKDPVKWSVSILYLKPVIVLLNIVPLFLMLIYFAKLLDHYAENDWAWFFSLFAAGWGTLLFAFDQTLNNHTIAASCAFFALYALIRVWDEGSRSWWPYLVGGFFGAFCTCNELPAAPFGVILFLAFLACSPRKTLLGFVPAAAVPLLAFFVTQYLAFGQFTPVYEEFGTKSYNWEGSPWTTPLEMDYFNQAPEPYPTYLFHMTFGHHGVFSLTPIFLFALWGALRTLVGEGRRLRLVAVITLLLTAAMLAFYTWNPKARNYGGSAQGLRWLFWLIPFWLLMLPAGVEAGQTRRAYRWLTVGALAVSAFSVGYALQYPWSHPWILDALEHLGLYSLKR